MNMKKFYLLDFSWDQSNNNEVCERLKSKNLQLKTFKDLDPFFEEITKLDYEVIFVLIRGRLYQDYFFKFKELRSTLKCNPRTIILMETPSPSKLIQLIENYLEYDIEEKIEKNSEKKK